MEYIQADIWVRFQRMQGHELFFVGADDAHGAPIMLKAEAEGITPQQLVARIGADRPRYLRGFHLSFDHWWSTDSPENTELSQEIYRRLQAAGLIYRKSVQQFYDAVKGMFLPDRYIKGECPNCHSKDQYGDSCEVCGTVYAPTELINPYSALSGAKPELRSSEHFFFRLSDPKLRAVPDRLAGRTGAPAAAGGQQGARVAARQRRAGPRRLGHLPRCALLRHPDPGRPGEVLLRVAGCADRLPRLAQALLRVRRPAQSRRAAQLRGIPRRPGHRADPLHRQGHHLLPHPLLAGDAEVRGRPVPRARPRVRARLHHGLGREDVEVARHRHLTAALP